MAVNLRKSVCDLNKKNEGYYTGNLPSYTPVHIISEEESMNQGVSRKTKGLNTVINEPSANLVENVTVEDFPAKTVSLDDYMDEILVKVENADETTKTKFLNQFYSGIKEKRAIILKKKNEKYHKPFWYMIKSLIATFVFALAANAGGILMKIETVYHPDNINNMELLTNAMQTSKWFFGACWVFSSFITLKAIFAYMNVMLGGKLEEAADTLTKTNEK